MLYICYIWYYFITFKWGFIGGNDRIKTTTQKIQITKTKQPLDTDVLVTNTTLSP